MPEVPPGDFLAARVAPIGKAELQIDVYDALAPAGDPIEQPAEAVAQARGQPVRQDREEFEKRDGKPCAETA
ncbi:hypothetical protein DP43_5677 [Burkholderia pseudomallei]|nr:hypothetical protein DP43_5677 [Burkholderia pseudomallei]